MKGQRLPFGSPEKRQNLSPQSTATDNAQNGNGVESGANEFIDAPASPIMTKESVSPDPSSALSTPRPKRKASAGSFHDMNGAAATRSPRLRGTARQDYSEGETPVKTSNSDSVKGRSRSSSMDTPSLTVVQPDGSLSVVRVIVEGKVYFPTRGSGKRKNVKTFVGNDGNQYHCQVCRQYGDVSCCDGCPRVYHKVCIPNDHASRKSLDNDDDPWYCPQCINKSNGTRSGKRTDKGDRKSSQHRCVDCNTRRSDLDIEPCIECGNYVHTPSCRDEDDGNGKVFCSTCRAVNALSREEMEAAGLNDPKSDEEEDEDMDDDEGSGQKKKRKKKQSKKKKKKRRQEEKERTQAIMEATGTTRTRVAGLPQATPAFYFYLGENRWKVERVLARKHRTFNRLPKGDERNALVAQEAAVWWSKLKPADQKRYIGMSMKDYEASILTWKDEKNIREMGLIQEQEAGPSEEDLQLEDDRIGQDYHERLYKATSVGSTTFQPKAGQSYNRLLLEFLHDARFHPFPMLDPKNSTKDSVENNESVALPNFDIHGPISTGVGDVCMGCLRGWAHFCPVLQRKVPAVEQRTSLQPPMSSLAATRVGLGLRLPLERDADPREGEESFGELFEWRDSQERSAMKRLSVLPSATLVDPASRLDDVVTFVEEAMYTKVPEPKRSQEEDNGDVTKAQDKFYKCGRCQAIVDSDTGCVPCRRAQLIVNTSKRVGSSRGKEREENKSLKVNTAMLGRVQTRTVAESANADDICLASRMLKHVWAPTAIVPPLPSRVPQPKSETMVVDKQNIDRQGDNNGELPSKVEASSPLTENDETGNSSSPTRNIRPSRKPSVPTDVDFGDPAERQRIREQRKRDVDALHKKSLTIACRGILLAITRRDPMAFFADPVDVEGYRDVVKSPMDISTVRNNVSVGKYTSMKGFFADLKLMCDNAISYNEEGSIHHEAAKNLKSELDSMQERGILWINAVKDAQAKSFEKKDAHDRNLAASKARDKPSVEPSYDLCIELQKEWPDAAHLLKLNEWLEGETEKSFHRTRENESAYYGALCVKRIVAAAEGSLSTYPDGNGRFGIASKRHHEDDEALRERIDSRVKRITHPGTPTDGSTAKEDAITRILRNVRNRKVDGFLKSDSGCSRCDEMDLLQRERKQFVVAETLLPSKKKREPHTPRTHVTRLALTTGLASQKARDLLVRNDSGDPDSKEDESQEILLSVHTSRIHGLGLIAGQEFKEDEVVIEFTGEYISKEYVKARTERYSGERLQPYFFELINGDAIDATRKGNLARYINHSCAPNCTAEVVEEGSRFRVYISAKQAIGVGEEITYDYERSLETDLSKRTPCSCRAQICRGFMNWDLPEKGENNRAILAQRRPASVRERVKKLGKPNK